MSLPPADLPFVSSQALPFDLYEPLLSWVFEKAEFRQWLMPNCKWQLRFVGGPGSGKTTLSTMTVRHLQKEFPNPNVRILSIFFTKVPAFDGPTLVNQLLREILRQLPAPTHKRRPRSSLSQADREPNGDASLGLEDVRKAVATKLSQLERSFLVLDDVDLCSQSQWTAVEGELARLQFHGVQIMTTSRLSLWHKYWVTECDTGWQSEHDSRLFWYCACQGSIEEGASTICQRCKDDGFRCSECGQSTDFVEPYDHVDLSMNIDDTVMSTYVAHALETVHGDLGLSSSANPKPSHSKLGRVLVRSADAATQLQRKIVDDAEQNIAMIKLRLATIDDATTIEEVVRYGDRLPATITALFDTVISDIQTRSSSLRELGFRAMIGAADEFHEQSFADLEIWLQRQIKQDCHDQSEAQRFSIEDVLRAAAGFITVGPGSDPYVGLYHGALRYYINQGYNETLFWWMYTGTKGVDATVFKKPRRKQTWHTKLASRDHLERRAST